MSWTNKYWDAVEQLYWTPKYLGLKSISKKYWEVSGDRVSVPKEMTNPNGPLYRRVTTGKEFSKLVRHHEETFNHIFELTFGILDGEIINQIFCQLLRESHQDRLKGYGRELGLEFGFPKLYDISQPDSFFVGNNWTIAVELKFDAKTSMDQLAKYLLALTLEREQNSGRKPVHLVYIAPEPEKLLKDAFPFETANVGSHQLARILAESKQSVVAPLLEMEATASSVLDDLAISAVSWRELDQVLHDLAMGFSRNNPEARTVNNLLLGLLEEIRLHPASGLK
ncbi:MAG: hypothetical protein P1U75_18820 [Antarcticimicrobium sp.]|uniref:hypothetical protein n=1 Tax=Antarcticimicrobium sp. TaxID=2824147 RepID=UPI0026097D49|nr:hypothetical protein [Antarcticimicrobium sp.]MDF1718697.1 hypothetical protein [Antarcticimicrobium sp.]